MKRLCFRLMFISVFLSFFITGIDAQLLAPQSLSYEQTGISSVEIKWEYPSEGISYPINPLDGWIPYDYWEGTSSKGMASDGKFVYSISGASFKKYDMEGNQLGTIVIPGLPAMGQFTYDGKQYFYGVADGGKSGKFGIYKIDMDSEELVDIIPTQMVLLHITYIPELDGGKGGFEAGNPDRGYFLRMDGSFIQNGPYYDPAVNTACVGTAYHDGKIYAICQRSGTYKVIVEYDMQTCLPTGNTFDLTDLSGHFGITSSQLALDLKFFEHGNTMNAVVSTYWSSTTDAGYRAIFFTLGERPELEGLQGYNIYRDNTKLNAVVMPVSTYSYADEGLDEGIVYGYSATAVYNGAESPHSDKLEVMLPLTNMLPLAEDFSSENLDDNRWTVFTNNQQPAWKIMNDVAALGGYLPSLAYTYRFSADYKQTITSRKLKIAEGDITLMRFDVYCTSNQTSEKLNIEVFRGNEWVTALSIPAWLANGWRHEQIELTEALKGYEGGSFQVRLSFSGSSVTPHNWYFDNVRIWNPDYVEFGGTAMQINTVMDHVDILLEKNDDTLIQYQTFTDENGRFYIESVEKGTYKLTISKGEELIYEDLGYAIDTSDKNVTLSILGALMEIDDAAIEIALSQGKSKIISLPVTNDGNAMLNWSAEFRFDRMGEGDEVGENNIKGRPAWEMVRTFELHSTAEEAPVYHKGHYYTYDNNYTNTGICKYSMEGEFIEKRDVSGIRSIVSDREKLYVLVSSYSGCYLAPIDFDSGVVSEGEKIDIPKEDPIGLFRYAEYDPTSDRFYVANEHYLYHVGKDGSSVYLGRFDEEYATYARGMAMDTFSEEGPYLWVATSLAGIAGGFNDTCGIFQYSIPQKDITSFYRPIDDLPGYIGKAVSNGLMLTTNAVPGFFTLVGIASYNSKSVLFVYKMLPFENWLSMEEMEGSIEKEAEGEMVVMLNTTQLGEGDSRSGNIIISSNSAGESINIPVKLTVDNSMEDKCLAPINLVAEVTAGYEVALRWQMPQGAEQIKGYYVYRDGVLLSKELAPAAEFTDTDPKMGRQRYTVQAVYSFGCESYESDGAEALVNNPDVVTPVSNAIAEAINKKHVQITWDKPIYAKEIFDDFEAYDAFIIDDIGPWKVYDGDKAWTHYGTGLSYPNMGERMAYMVFNPGKCSSEVTTPDGSKQLLSAFSANVDGMANNDWIISPELDFDQAFIFSFMARTYSYNYPKEKINIGYSLTGDDIDDFIFINGGEPIELIVAWEKYDFQIPAEAKYVAINCVSMNSFMCLFDNLFIGRPENYSDFLGYNIYRDNVKLNTSLFNEASFREYNLADGEYTYEVEALFANGIASKTTSNKISISYSHEIAPPRDLEGTIEEQHITLNWLPPLWEDEQELRYDDGVPYDSGGNVEGEQLIAIGFDGNEMNVCEGYSITGVQFYVADEVEYVVPFLFVNGEPVRISEEMQIEPNQYITYYFEQPVVIEANTHYIIGYSYEAAGLGFYPASHDKNPGTPGKSDLISNDGFHWYSTGELWGSEWNINWNIAALIELQGEVGKSTAIASNRWEKSGSDILPSMDKSGNPKSTMQTQAFTDLLLGYKVYRNDECITPEPLSQLEFADTAVDVNENNIKYYVAAVYAESGEMKSNEILFNYVGIHNPEQSISFYPNPAKETLYIKGEFDSVSLTTLEGKTIFKGKRSASYQNTIDVSGIEPGVYILVLSKDNKSHYNKLIIL